MGNKSGKQGVRDIYKSIEKKGGVGSFKSFLFISFKLYEHDWDLGFFSMDLSFRGSYKAFK